MNKEISLHWRKIAEAPMDGTAILLWPYEYYSTWDGRADPEVVLGYWSSNDEEWFNPETQKTFDPTHFMYLPPPPESQS